MGYCYDASCSGANSPFGYFDSERYAMRRPNGTILYREQMKAEVDKLMTQELEKFLR